MVVGVIGGGMFVFEMVVGVGVVHVVGVLNPSSWFSEQFLL